MKPALKSAIHDAVLALSMQGLDIRSRLTPAAIKALGDMGATRANYNAAIVDALTMFGANDSGMVPARNNFIRAMAAAFTDAFDTGYTDGGGELPAEDDDNAWLGAREDEEIGHITDLFFSLKELLKTPDFDYFSWATDRADAYCDTLDGIYDQAKARGAANKMLTFAGEDGGPDSPCQKNGGTCVQLKDQRHRASWWISHDLIPYPGNPNFSCGCWNCQHGLQDDNGEWFTTDPTKRAGHLTYKSAAIPPQLAEDPKDANAAWLETNNPRLSIYATGTDEDGSAMTAWLVDGDAIRSNIWQDWTSGGNHERYPWIPAGECWLDVDNLRECKRNLGHETAENRDMRDAGDTYPVAHSKHANVVEFEMRHGPRSEDEILKELGWKV